LQNLYNDLEALLLDDPALVDEHGKLNKNVLVTRAANLDADFLARLLSSEPIRKHFFETLGETLVFDKVKFQEFIANKAFLPDSYTAFRNKIGLTDRSGRFLSASEDVVLAWPYKDCVLEGGMTKEDIKRDEIFWNTTLAPDDITRLFEPKALTGFERWDAEAVAQDKPKKVEGIDPDNDNLFIKGNNLLALHSLMQTYAGRVTVIYIDPPFNTGNDSFLYNDRFSRSTWLTFMRSRLEVMKSLLAQDGSIFIHIDINQSHYLKSLCDEVMGEENFVQEIIWAYGSPSGGRAGSAKPVNIHDYILHYARDYRARKQNRLYTPYSDQYIQNWFRYEDDDGRQYRSRMRDDGTWGRQYLDESPGVPLTTVWSDIKQVYADPRAYRDDQAEHSELVKGFLGQKPERLIKRILDMASDEGDIVADFFSGTGTTASAAMKMNRRFITTEQIEGQVKLTRRRLFKTIRGAGAGISRDVGWTGGGSFVYFELAEANDAWATRIRSASDEGALAGVAAELREKGWWRYKLNQSLWDWVEWAALAFDERKQVLIDSLDANHLYVNYGDIDDADTALSAEDIAITKAFYEGEA
jgi:adenine-specific DNA-methyltransferase